MKKETIFIANWKMNLNINTSEELLSISREIINENNKSVKLVFCPQFLLIPNISRFFVNSSNFYLGAQDCHYNVNGAFTGDSSIDLLKKFNCKYIIAGHSERRTVYKELSADIFKKINLINEFSLFPILCVGEYLENRKNKNYLNFLSKQILESIPENTKKLLIAYEPIWSIGTGIIPSMKEIEEIADFIKFCVNKNFPGIESLKILYGGSVNSNNFEKIISISNINGCLVGGSSIKVEEYVKMLKKLI
tara:strand:- start:724 stop:1470 length:747 start_codon:yes stop_codon:yes gene_type:complete